MFALDLALSANLSLCFEGMFACPFLIVSVYIFLPFSSPILPCLLFDYVNNLLPLKKTKVNLYGCLISHAACNPQLSVALT